MAWSLPEFLEKAQSKWEGKLVAVEKLNEANELLKTANARIVELEKIDAKALTDRIAALEGDVTAKDATIKAHVATISALEGNFKTAARQAQEQIARAGASAPVVNEAPKNPEGAKDEATQFVEKVALKVSGGLSKANAVAACVREFPSLHVAFIKSGKNLS